LLVGVEGRVLVEVLGRQLLILTRLHVGFFGWLLRATLGLLFWIVRIGHSGLLFLL
jgi:hypothetical protein